MSPAFRLTPEEEVVLGISVRDGALRISSSGTQRIEAGLSFAGAALVVVLGIADALGGDVRVNGYRLDRPGVGVALFVVLAIAAVAHGVVVLRSGVVASPSGLAVRRRWRLRSWGWDEIADLQAVDTDPQRWRAVFGPGAVGFTMHPVSSYSLGVLVTVTGDAVALPGLRCASRSEGLSMGHATATEIKVGALRRYRDRVVGAWPTAVAPRTYDDLRVSTRSLVAWAVLVPPALWAVVELGTREDVGVAPLVMWWVFAGIGLAWFTWRRQ